MAERPPSAEVMRAYHDMLDRQQERVRAELVLKQAVFKEQLAVASYAKLFKAFYGREPSV